MASTTTLTVQDSANGETAKLALEGDYSASSWTVTEDAAGTGVDIADPPAKTGPATINAGAGDAALKAFGGGDTFVFKPNMGNDAIANFHADASPGRTDHRRPRPRSISPTIRRCSTRPRTRRRRSDHARRPYADARGRAQCRTSRQLCSCYSAGGADHAGAGSGGSRLRAALRRYVPYDRMSAIVLLLAMAVLRDLGPAAGRDGAAAGIRRLSVDSAAQVARRGRSTIVDIDEASLAALGQWPWPRARVAEIVTKLKTLGAVAIGFDVVFRRARPHVAAPPSPRRCRSSTHETRARAASAAEQRRRARGGFQGRARGARRDRARPRRRNPRSPKVRLRDPRPRARRRSCSTIPACCPMFPRSNKRRRDMACSRITPERDGIARRVPMVLAIGDDLVPSLTLEMLRVLDGRRRRFC